jgi:hypothetical protein
MEMGIFAQVSRFIQTSTTPLLVSLGKGGGRLLEKLLCSISHTKFPLLTYPCCSPPAAIISIAIIALFLPANFPNNGQEKSLGLWKTIGQAPVRRLDGIGAGLLLGSSVLLVFAFEEAGFRYPWSSPAVISTLAVGSVAFLGFVFWEYNVGKRPDRKVPVFPLRLLKDRKIIGLLL